MLPLVPFAKSYPLYSEDLIPSVVTDEGGEVHHMAVKARVNISDPEYSKNHFPNPADYTLQNLIDAGVSLQEVPSPLLGVPIDVDSALDKAFDVLNDDNNFKTDK